MFLSKYIFLALFLVRGEEAHAAGETVIFGVPDIAQSPDDTVTFSIGQLPMVGNIFVGGTAGYTGLAIPDFSYVSYVPSVPNSFSVIAGTNCSGSDFADFFWVNALRTTYENSNPVNTEETTEQVSICLVDVQDVPLGANLILAIDSNETAFNLSVTDYDDRRGDVDQLWSTFAFHDENGLTDPYSGIQFIQTTNPIGEIRRAACLLDALIQSTTYFTTTFCFVYTGNGSSNETNSIDFSFRPVDSAGGIGPIRTLTIRTRELMVCGSPLFNDTGCIKELEENTNSSSFLSPAGLRSVQSFDYHFRVEGLPTFGTISMENGSTVEVGYEYLPFERLYYTPPGDYYNCFETGFGQYDCVDPYNRTIGSCVDPDGCFDSFQYRAVGSLTISTLGVVEFLVFRRMGTKLKVCIADDVSTDALVDPNLPPCTSYAMEGETIPIYMTAEDGGKNPSYFLRITSLPENGKLYRNLQDSSVSAMVGALVQVGDVFPPLSAGPGMLYIGNALYHTMFRYDTSPNPYYKYVDDSCTDLVGECADSFTFVAYSAYNASLVSAPGTYHIGVARDSGPVPMVCGDGSYSEWDTACVSFGFESNQWYGDYDIAVYLNANNTGSIPYKYVIRSLPQHGVLSLNIGDPDSLERGTIIEVGMFILPSSNKTEPELIYTGNLGYYTEVHYETSSTTQFKDLKGLPMNGVTCLGFDVNGCPDSFVYEAVALDDNDGSIQTNPGTYYVHVQNSMDTGELIAPITIRVEEGETFRFTGVNYVRYNDPDEDLYHVWVEITAYTGLVGTTASVDGLTFRVSKPCFIAEGCNGQVDFYGATSDINRAFTGLFFTYNASMTIFDNSTTDDYGESTSNNATVGDDDYVTAADSDPETVVITITKCFPDGLDPGRPFVNNLNDLVIVKDIFYGNDSASDDDYDDPTTPEDAFHDDLVAIQKSQLNVWIIVGASIGGLIVVLIIGLIMYYYMNLPAPPPSSKKNKKSSTKVLPEEDRNFNNAVLPGAEGLKNSGHGLNRGYFTTGSRRASSGKVW